MYIRKLLIEHLRFLIQSKILAGDKGKISELYNSYQGLLFPWLEKDKRSLQEEATEILESTKDQVIYIKTRGKDSESFVGDFINESREILRKS